MRGAVRTLVAVAGLMTTACSGFEPDGAEPIAASAQFHAWWSATEACAGLTGDLGRVEFAIVPGQAFACPTGWCVGRWEPGHRIYLAGDYVGNELVVRHEMLHELLGQSGHPPAYFEQRCRLTWETWPGGTGVTVDVG